MTFVLGAGAFAMTFLLGGGALAASFPFFGVTSASSSSSSSSSIGGGGGRGGGGLRGSGRYLLKKVRIGPKYFSLQSSRYFSL